MGDGLHFRNRRRASLAVGAYPDAVERVAFRRSSLLLVDTSSAAAFTLALLSMEGVGRVTAARLTAHFASFEALRRFPREQVLLRLKGAPNAEALVSRLFDEDLTSPLFADALARAARLGERRIRLLCPRDAAWPSGLDALPRPQRPLLLYAYGSVDALRSPSVAFLARPPLPEAALPRAEALVRHLAAEGVHPATGASHGFDVVVSKLCSDATPPRPAVLVAACGLARVPRPVRPAASQAVKAGGVLVSTFDLEHGPFEHDERERALVLAALADAAVFVAPTPASPEWAAMTWALEADRPVFALPHPEYPLPGAVHRIESEVDFEWVRAATEIRDDPATR